MCWLYVICLFVCVFGDNLSKAQTITSENFGSGANKFSIDFVSIKNVNNNPDITGFGSVKYEYALGKYEISRDVILKANLSGNLGISLYDMSAYGGNGGNRPATGVSWFEAARFVNYLNISQGSVAAYKFDSNGNFQLWSAGDIGYNSNNLFRNSLCLITILILSFQSFAQISLYTFSSSAGSYVPISGTDLFGSNWDDGSSNLITIPFTFNYDYIPYNTLSVGANGFITLGSVASTSGYCGFAGGITNSIAAYCTDLVGGPASSVQYSTRGNAPNRQFVVQWTDLLVKTHLTCVWKCGTMIKVPVRSVPLFMVT